MQAASKVSNDLLPRLRCPVCASALRSEPGALVCRGSCGTRFPVLDGVPVLLNEERSIFSLSDFEQGRETYFRKTPPLRKLIGRVMPSISYNFRAAENYRRFLEALPRTEGRRPVVLVIGGGILGDGMQAVVDSADIELLETDIAFAPRTQLICDAHDLPLQDGSVDGVIAQAVLEHVPDPYRCVEEFHRVLVPGGVVYAETPFMQQVHSGPYDFMRFSHMGHRRLFRHFSELESGAACGPGMALAWSFQYFLMSFARGPRTRDALLLASRFSSFWLKYFDRLVISSAGTLDAASAYFFLGKKEGRMLTDRELVRLYRGGMPRR